MNSSVFFKISKQFLFTSLDSAVLLFGSLKLSSKESKKSRTLLIRIDNIGDFILWIPTAKKTKEIYSEEYLILIVQKSVQDLAKLLPYWDEVIAIDEHRLRNNFTYRWKTLWQIKTLGAKVGIEFAFSRSILAGDSIIRWSGAQKRIGSSGNLSNIPKVSKRISNSWYTELISADSAELHELERNAEFIQNLTQQNIPVQLPQLPQLVDAPPPAEKFVVLFPGASLIEKQWPTKNFAVCADFLSQHYQLSIVLCGTESEWKLCEEIRQQSVAQNINNCAGKTTLPQLVEWLRCAQLLITNDTSAVHIASAVNTPSICILGGGHFGRFLPYPKSLEGIKPTVIYEKMPCYGCDWRCKHTDYQKSRAAPCIQVISPEQVCREADQLLRI